MTFLLVFSLFTSSEMNRYVSSTFREKLFSAYTTEKQSAHRQKQKALLQQFKSAVYEKDPNDLEIIKSPSQTKKKSSSPKKRCYKLNFDLNRPPDNARFNLRPLLINPNKKIGQKTLSDIFEKLLINLYRDAPFFQNNPSFEKRITEALLLEKDKLQNAEFADAIAILNFENDQMREGFYKMLKGEGDFPSLLNYLALDPSTKSKINLLFAPRELIYAFIDHSIVAEKIIACRDEIVSEMCLPDTSLTRLQISRYLKENLERIAEEEKYLPDLKSFFEYRVGKPGRLIFFKDPLTNKLRYEKILLPQALPENLE